MGVTGRYLIPSWDTKIVDCQWKELTICNTDTVLEYFFPVGLNPKSRFSPEETHGFSSQGYNLIMSLSTEWNITLGHDHNILPAVRAPYQSSYRIWVRFQSFLQALYTNLESRLLATLPYWKPDLIFGHNSICFRELGHSPEATEVPQSREQGWGVRKLGPIAGGGLDFLSLDKSDWWFASVSPPACLRINDTFVEVLWEVFCYSIMEGGHHAQARLEKLEISLIEKQLLQSAKEC